MQSIQTKCIVRLLWLLLFFTNNIFGQETQPNYWEQAIQQFEAADQANPPEKNGILFIGSSSIRLWQTLADDFPFVKVLNRGFGGSEMSDLVYFVNRIVIPYEPSAIVVYSGDNDIANGKNPTQVLSDFQTFVKMVHDSLPQTLIALISIKPSIARWDKVDQMKTANELLKNYIEKNPFLTYVDTFTAMLDEDGNVRSDLLGADGLHLNTQGYQLWARKVEPFLKRLVK